MNSLFTFANRNYYQVLIVLILMIYLWIVSGWNIYNSDYENYRVYYDVLMSERAVFGALDFGYHYLSSIFSNFGLDFEEFRIVIYGIGMFLVGYYCLRWSKFPIICLMFYISFHFLRDVVQTRNFIASLFILFSIEYMFDNSKKSKLYLFIMIFLGCSVHMSFVLYFVLLFVGKIRKISYFKLLLICVILSFMSKILMNVFVSILSIEGLNEKVDNYLKESPVWATVVASSIAIMNGLVLKYYIKRSKQCFNTESIYLRNIPFDKYSLVIFNINTLMSICVIFTSINFSFYGRLFGNILLINIIFITNILYYMKGRRNFIDCAALFIYVVVCIYFMQITPFDQHIDAVMYNNSFLNN